MLTWEDAMLTAFDVGCVSCPDRTDLDRPGPAHLVV